LEVLLNIRVFLGHHQKVFELQSQETICLVSVQDLGYDVHDRLASDGELEKQLKKLEILVLGLSEIGIREELLEHLEEVGFGLGREDAPEFQGQESRYVKVVHKPGVL